MATGSSSRASCASRSCSWPTTGSSSPERPRRFHFGTWIGGDLDGNPSAGPETIAEALARARELTLTAYSAEVRELAGAIGISDRLVPRSPELDESIARDERELPEYAAQLADRNLDEPYRRKLSFVWRKLRNGLEPAAGPGYGSASELASDLDLLDRSLRQAAVGPGRRRQGGSAAAPSRALRLPAREARRARPRERAARRLGPPRRDVRRDRPRAGGARRRRARHADRVRHELGGRRARRARPRRGSGARRSRSSRSSRRSRRSAPRRRSWRRSSTTRASATSSPSGDRGSRSWSATRTRARTAAT